MVTIFLQYHDALKKFEKLNGENLCVAAWELELTDTKYDEWGNLKLIQTTPLKDFVENIHNELDYQHEIDNDPEWREVSSKFLQNQRKKGPNGINEGFVDLIVDRQNYVIIRKLTEIIKEKASKVRMEMREVRIRDSRQQNWEYFVYPIDELEARKVIDTIREAVFRADEVSQHESRFSTLFTNDQIDRTDPEINKEAIRNKAEHAAKKPEPISAENDGDQEKFASHLGKIGACKRWAPHNELMKEAESFAEKKYQKGSRWLHNEMTDAILKQPEFKALKERRPALLKKIKLIADNYGLVRGKKGVKKEKK